MTAPEIDYAAVFAASPSAYVLLGPDLVIRDVNSAYLELTLRVRDELVGRHIFDVFPENRSDPDADGIRSLRASLHRALTFRRVDTIPLQKYDIPVAGKPGVFEERWWHTVNTPLLAPDGSVSAVLCREEDMTGFIRSYQEHGRPPDGTEAGATSLHPPHTDAGGTDARTKAQSRQRPPDLTTQLYARAQELVRINEELRRASAQERQVALRLQEAMLYSTGLPRPNIAVRYLPATGTLNVCGDWYDVTDSREGRFAAAVGDVVGHGLEAAAVMGMLRSALSAAMRTTDRPARALQVLGLYAGSVEGAMNATAVKVMVDSPNHLLTYSSAGHPPPILRHADGTCELLDQATDPPLATRPDETEPRVQATRSFSPGAVLVLYTDGLVERRDEDIDEGLNRLADAVSRRGDLSPENLADALLSEMGVSKGAARDDIALVVIRL
ncbi:SpoIIE family protein phosphatase [Streptomyces albus subsp. chlorinus]|uniref:SpoIIE family protein phosphatase n=1 Tax=Streptomyces albus TaxID=1888 RepID=UPI00156E1F59|nr:SpoIIE family protein phosphatase [Streptomyces albus subsp. chlorinus]